MSSSNPLVFYDISSPLQPRSYAPNPSKARFALGLKGVAFKTNYVDLLDISDVRKGLNCPAVRKLDDGSDFFTLPMLQDPESGKVVGDSFDIAEYLEEKFPGSGGCLFPANSTHTGLDYESPNKDSVFFAPVTADRGLVHKAYANFNVHVDTTFSANIAVCAQYMPFNPKTAEAVKALMAKRAHLPSWDVLSFDPDTRRTLFAAMQAGLASLAQYFLINDSGPFLEGEHPNYADIIVGGWVNYVHSCLPAEEWAEFRTWHNGAFGKLHDALHEKYFPCPQ